jgi:hypothetical protein
LFSPSATGGLIKIFQVNKGAFFYYLGRKRGGEVGESEGKSEREREKERAQRNSKSQKEGE